MPVHSHPGVAFSFARITLVALGCFSSQLTLWLPHVRCTLQRPLQERRPYLKRLACSSGGSPTCYGRFYQATEFCCSCMHLRAALLQLQLFSKQMRLLLGRVQNDPMGVPSGGTVLALAVVYLETLLADARA